MFTSSDKAVVSIKGWYKMKEFKNKNIINHKNNIYPKPFSLRTK